MFRHPAINYMPICCFLLLAFQQLQEEFNRRRELVDAVKTRGEELKPHSSKCYNIVSSKLENLERRFGDVATAFNQRHAR